MIGIIVLHTHNTRTESFLFFVFSEFESKQKMWESRKSIEMFIHVRQYFMYWFPFLHGYCYSNKEDAMREWLIRKKNICSILYAFFSLFIFELTKHNRE